MARAYGSALEIRAVPAVVAPPDGGGTLTIAIAGGPVDVDAPAVPPRRSRRRLVKRILLIAGAALFAVMASLATLVGVSLWRIDHNVHHVGVPAALLAKGKNDLLAIVQGPNHSEEAYVFHQTASNTKVLTIPSALAVPVAGGRTAPLKSLDIHTPSVIIRGLDKLGIPVSHYVGVDLHAVSPNSNLGQLASGKLSITSMISNPTGTTSLLGAVASHIYLGPGTPVSAVLSLMNVPTAHPVEVPTSRDSSGNVVLASAFAAVLRSFL
jgi:hypothetical protein